MFSAILEHDFPGGVTGELGLTNANEFGLGTGQQNWFARVGYNFCFKK